MIPGFVLAISAAAGTLTLISAAWKFLEDTARSKKSRAKERYDQVERLLLDLKGVHDVLNDVVDHESERDAHLRINQAFEFTETEMATRIDVDRAMEHFRRVRDAARLGLIEHEDLGPWVYWIYRTVACRKPVREYAVACGYGAFRDDLKRWTARSVELKELRASCPWLGTRHE